MFSTLVVVFFFGVTNDMTKNFNEQRLETIGCEQAKKAMVGIPVSVVLSLDVPK